MDFVIQLGSLIGPVLLLGLVALPSFVSVLRQRGLLLGGIAILGLGIVIICLEAASIKSGLPYGRFSYDESLSGKLFGTTPWFIVLAYAPLFLAAFWLGSFWTQSHGRISLSVIITVAMSAAIEPALSALEIRQWQSPGFYFGVPLIAFIGWFLTATIAGGLLHFAWRQSSVQRGIAYSGLFMLLFFTGINIGTKQWVPAGVSGGLGMLILILFAAEKWKTRHDSFTA